MLFDNGSFSGSMQVCAHNVSFIECGAGASAGGAIAARAPRQGRSGNDLGLARQTLQRTILCREHFCIQEDRRDVHSSLNGSHFLLEPFFRSNIHVINSFVCDVN